MLALASLVAVTALAFGDAAAFSVSNTFGSHMALQRDSPIPVWGWGAPGAAVRVTVGTSTGAATVSADGFWRAVLPALPPSFTPTTLNATSTTTGETVILEDVLIGDVFLCSGQSNMEFTVNDVINATAELAAANNYPSIRVTSGPLQGKLDLHDVAPTPYSNLLATDLPWAVANNETIGGVGGGGGWDFFSASCWFTLKGIADANAARDDPVPLGGIVQCYGGTSIQWWSSPAALASCPPAPGSACCNYGGNNSCLYNAQIAPYLLGPTGLAGFLWYQGEQNAGCGGPPQIDYYACALPALISDWRRSFGNEDLPFGIFLLAAWGATSDSFPLLRLIQVNTSITVPRVFTASTLDLGQPVGGGPVHSPYKQLAGRRASAGMEAFVYGQPTDYRGPRYAGAAVTGATVTVSFDPASLYGSPLVLNASVSCPPTLCVGCCEDFALQTAGSCEWFSVSGGNVSLALAGGGSQLRLTLLGAAAQTGAVVASRGYFANWPIVSVLGSNGVPIEPWLANVTEGVGCAPPPPAVWDGATPALDS